MWPISSPRQPDSCSKARKTLARATFRRATRWGPAAARDEAAGEIILKVVNPTEADQTVQVALNGANQVSATARATVLAGKPNDEDSMAQPEKVFPVQSELQNVSANFSAPFPAHSLSVLRIKTQ